VTGKAKDKEIRTMLLLILDDLGVQRSTEWAWEKIYQVLVYRRTYRLLLAMMTNLDVERLPDRRVASRLSKKG